MQWRNNYTTILYNGFRLSVWWLLWSLTISNFPHSSTFIEKLRRKTYSRLPHSTVLWKKHCIMLLLEHGVYCPEMSSKRQHYPAKFKVQVVAYAEKNGNRDCFREYGVSEVNVRLWRKQKEKLNHCSKTRKTFSGPKMDRFSEIDYCLDLFVKQYRSSYFSVIVQILQAKAREIYCELWSSVRFTASRGRICCFMKRVFSKAAYFSMSENAIWLWRKARQFS